MRRLPVIGTVILGLSAVAAVPALARDRMPMAGPGRGPGRMPPFLGGNNIFNSQGGPLPRNPMSPAVGTNQPATGQESTNRAEPGASVHGTRPAGRSNHRP